MKSSQKIFIKKTILVLLVLIAITEGCKKYKDGPLITFRTVIGRLCNDGGRWEVKYFSIDGVDTTNGVLNSPSYSIYRFIYDPNSPAWYLVGESTNLNSGFSGFFELMDKNNILNIGFYPNKDTIPSIGPYQKEPGSIDWKILKLTFNDLWVENNYNNRNYFIKYKKIKK